MITSVQLRHLRGIEVGSIEGLAPLTVLVGRNGSGKSTVLEALAIGAGHQPGEIVGRVVAARGGWNGARYLVHNRAPDSSALVQANFAGGEVRGLRLGFNEQPGGIELDELPRGADPTSGPFTSVDFVLQRSGFVEFGIDEPAPGEAMPGRTVFQLDNRYGFRSIKGLLRGDRVEFIHPGASRSHPLWRDHREAAEQGRLDDVQDLLRSLLGERFRSLQVLQESDDGRHSNVSLIYSDGAVPVAVAGDGVRSLVRLALQLAGRPGTVLLIEEPEVHQHPGAIWLTARAILAAVERGVQVILTTHSLELVDGLVEQGSSEALGRMRLFQVGLQDGVLRSNAVDGARVLTLREALAEDLRG